MPHAVVTGGIAAKVLERLLANPNAKFTTRELATEIGCKASSVGTAVDRIIKLDAISVQPGKGCRILSAGPRIMEIKVVDLSMVQKTTREAIRPPYDFSGLLAVWGIRRPKSLAKVKWVQPWQRGDEEVEAA